MSVAGAVQDLEAFASHLQSPRGKGHTPEGALTGAAGGAACGDVVRISLAIDERSPAGRIVDVGFDASGCGASIAAGSAAVSLVLGAPLLDAARVGAADIAAELGGLSPGKLHAAELACDALHRALGLVARQKASLAPVARRAAVAMSGGVDSAVAALLTARGGDEPVALTVELWADAANDGERSCCSASAVRYARALAHRLAMPHFSIDLREEFRAGVVEPWLADHEAGLTPYPCARCNGEVRLDGMLEVAERLGASTLVTGHYVRLAEQGDLVGRRHDGAASSVAGSHMWDPAEGRACAPLGRAACGPAAIAACGDGPPPFLRAALDEAKDQSYALAAVSQSTLAKLRFPLGGFAKGEVRALAGQAGLAVAHRPDSQDLCFLAGTDKRAFLARHRGIVAAKGAILDEQGRVLGEHEGVSGFTIGQRRGLGIGGGEPLYVLATDVAANTVTVGPRERLRTAVLKLSDALLRCDGSWVDAVKIRYRGARLPCELLGDGGKASIAEGFHARLDVRLGREVERTAAGQLACLYRGDVVVGYGTIRA